MSLNIITELIILRDTDKGYYRDKKRESDIIIRIIISVKKDLFWVNIPE